MRGDKLAGFPWLDQRETSLKQIPPLPGYALVNMNTISMTAKATTLDTRDRVLLKSVDELLAGEQRSATQRVRALVPSVPRRATSAKRVAKHAWITPVSESLGEKLLYGVVAGAAVWAVAYGFLSVVEHAENWAVFNAWVGRILGA